MASEDGFSVGPIVAGASGIVRVRFAHFEPQIRFTITEDVSSSLHFAKFDIKNASDYCVKGSGWDLEEWMLETNAARSSPA